jgi:transcriptional regulator with XRE-family HTH domain
MMISAKKSMAAVFAANVKTLMERRKLNQVQLGAKAGVSQRHISNVLRQVHGPSTDIIEKIASAFGLPGWLLMIPNLPPELLDSTELLSVVERYSTLVSGRT